VVNWIRNRAFSKSGLLLGSFVLLALLLRLAGRDHGFYQDEFFTIEDLRSGSLGGIWNDLVNGPEVTPPLYFVVLWPFSGSGDPNFLWMVPSLLAGLSLIPVVFGLARRIGGTTAGLVASLLTAVAPSFIVYSVEIRPYMLLVLLLTFSTLALITAVEGGGRVWWALYGLAGALALWTHYTAAFVLGAQGVVAYLAYRPCRRQLVLANIATALAFAPWLPFVEEKASMSWYPKPNWLNALVLVRTFPGEQFMPRTPDSSSGFFSWRFLVLYLFWMLGAAVLWRAWKATRSGETDRRPLLLVCVAGLAMPTAVAVNSIVSNYGMFTPRHIFAFAPYAAVLLGWAFANTRGRFRTTVAGLMMLIVVLFVGLHFTAAARKPQYWRAAEIVSREIRPGDVVLDALPGQGRRFETPLRILTDRGTLIKVERLEGIHVLSTGQRHAALWLVASPKLTKLAKRRLRSYTTHGYRIRSRWNLNGAYPVIVLRLTPER